QRFVVSSISTRSKQFEYYRKCWDLIRVSLNQTISATPTQSEVQAISDKVDELLGNLRDAGHL
ncbi:MAG: hypothetical protein AB2669_19940, partial [Candidatus Thiodiazotropha endolucinida]